MSQGLISVANGSGAAVRAAINAAFARLATKASGTARPADIQTGESWFETDNPGGGVWSLWLWDGTADCLLGTLDTGTHVFQMAAAGLGGLLTTQGDILYRGASAAERLAAAANNLSALFSGGGAANPSWAGTWKLFGTADPSAASSLSFTSIPSSVNHVMLSYELTPSLAGNGVACRTYDAGGSLDSGASDYSQLYFSMTGSGTTSNVFNQSKFDLAGAVDTGNTGFAGHLMLHNIQRATNTKFTAHSVWQGTTNYTSILTAGHRAEADRITGIQMFPGAGTITGKVNCWVAV